MGELACRVTLEHEGSASLTEKKSEFIGYACPVKTEQEAIDYIRAIRKKHADARHNVYAYVVGNTTRYSDDGEPQGTGGIPVLDVIRKSGFGDAVIVVTRYFGGILLGAGGLVRMYSAAAAAAVAQAHIITYREYTELSFACAYADYPKIESGLPRFAAIVDGVDFTDTVALRIAVTSDRADQVCTWLQELSGGRITAEVVGMRFDI